MASDDPTRMPEGGEARLRANGVRLHDADPTFETEDGVPYWLRPVHRDPDLRRKLLRKQIFAGIVIALKEVERQRARILAGSEQGGLIALCCARPLVIEAACRARMVTPIELKAIRTAWSGMVTILVCDPVLTQSATTPFEDFVAAVPEFLFLQPRGLQLIHLKTQARNCFTRFAMALGEAVWGFNSLSA